MAAGLNSPPIQTAHLLSLPHSIRASRFLTAGRFFKCSLKARNARSNASATHADHESQEVHQAQGCLNASR
jgi:hypothetical protein